MEKTFRVDDDPNSLTSFNFIPEGDEEGLISKIFSKFKSAVSGPNQPQQVGQTTSPSSSTQTVSIILSNESNLVTDLLAEQQQQEKIKHIEALDTTSISSKKNAPSIKDNVSNNDNKIIPEKSSITSTPVTTTTTTAATSTVNPATTTTTTATTNATTTTSSTAATNTTTATNTPTPSATTIIASTTTATNKSENDNSSIKTTKTVVPVKPKTTTTTISTNIDASTTSTKIPITINTPSTPSPSLSKPNTPSSHKHIIIDEDQNQLQQIPSNMLIPLTKTPSIDSDTQSVMTTFSVSNTNSLSRILNRLRGSSEPIDSNKDFWIPDEQCKECNNCKSPFNLFRRKHHCRTCGRIFCSKCLTNNIHTSHSLRVCNDCYRKYLAGYHAEDTVSLHDGYSYSSVVVDNSISSSLIPQPSQQKSILIPTDDDSSDDEIEFERPTNSIDLPRPNNLELHISQSTSSHHTTSDTDVGIKKFLTNTLLRGTPRSRTSTMNSLGIDTSLAALEGTRQQLNSPMPFRRNSLVVNNPQYDAHSNVMTSHISGHGSHTPTQQHQAYYYDGEDDDPRRWDKVPSNLLNFLGSGNNGERPNSGIFNIEDFANLDSPTTATVATPVLSTSTSTMNKPYWFMRSGNNERPNNIIRRRLSLTENVSSSNLNGSTSSGSPNNSNLNSGSSTSSGRYIRVRTKSLMRNTPITTASLLVDQNDSSSTGYESPSSSSGTNNYRHSFPQQLTPSCSTPVITNRSMTPEMDQLRTQILSVPASHPPVTVATHQQWDASFILLVRNIIIHLLEESGLSRSEWEEVMMKLLLKIADEVQPHLRLRDTFNMTHYVKIKKVPGGLTKDSFSVSGVVFSKSVAHKSMIKKVKNPSILILNFDVDGFSSVTSAPNMDGTTRLEYLKFDTLLEWERRHIDDLVTKIIELKPHIVLFASNVPRTIIDCLNEAKIIVASNVKKQKLDAIARCADATVFNYKNELWNANRLLTGKCGLFEPLTILHEYLPNRRKTYLMFHNCPKERGATIVLRGGDLTTLNAAKFIMNFMVKVINNINLEAQLRKDFIELRRWNLHMYDDDDSVNLDEDGVTTLENGHSMDDDSSTIHQHHIRGARSTTISSYHAEGTSSSEALHMDTQSVSALSVAESQMTVNTIDVAAAKKKSQQQYQQSTVIVEDDDICLTAVNIILKQYQVAILSISPGVSLPVPHILLRLRESLKKLIGIIREKLGVHITGNVLTTESIVPPVSPVYDEKHGLSKQLPAIPPIPTDLNNLQDYLKAFDAYLEHDLEYRHYQDLYLQCWLLYKRHIGDVHQYLSPIYHQQILVRRTTTPAEDHTIPCEKAALDSYEYYNPNADCTLVQYILKTVKDASMKCSSKMCDKLLIFHDRTYSHGNAQVKVQVYFEEENGDEDLIEENHIDFNRDEQLRKIPIFMSTYCNICKVQHPWRTMSELLQRYSFGKFLELLFYQSDPIALYDATETDKTCSTEDADNIGCPHGFYRDHTISFRIQNLSVNFTHAMVQVLEVAPPPLHLRFSSKQQMAIKDALLDSTRSKIAKFFDSIIERNKSFSYDSVLPNMVERCKEYLQDLSQEAMKNKKNLLQRLQMEYATSAPTDTLQLNNVLAELKNQVVTWDIKYVDFARQFVRPERELRRLTTNQLRKMFPAENLYNTATTNTQALSSLNLRTKRAIEAPDLPLLDVDLDTSSHSLDLSIESNNNDKMLDFKEQPILGESPTESYPWFDELKRFDQMFMQDGKTRNENLSQSVDSQNSQLKEISMTKKSASTDLDKSQTSTSNTVVNSSQQSTIDLEEDSSRDLDPSVARRLSLELMKDAPKKKQEQKHIENKKQQQERKKNLKYVYEPRLIEQSSNDTLNSTINSPTTSSSKSSLPIPIILPSKDQSSTELKNQAQFSRHTSGLPILSSTTYKRLAGLLPEPIVSKSKSSPSPVNYLYTPQQQQQQQQQQHQRNLKMTEQKKANRRSAFIEPSYNLLDDDEQPQPQQQQSPQQQSPQQQQQQHLVVPPTKPSFYRGSPYTAKIQDHSTIAYRYGFMSGLNSGFPLVERRLGATNITHPVSSAIAAANAAAAAAAAAAASSNTTTSTTTDVSNTTNNKNNNNNNKPRDLTMIRPRSRTMAIVNVPTTSKSLLTDQQSTSKARVVGRIPVLDNKLNNNKMKNSTSFIPIPSSQRQKYRHSRHYSESKINPRIDNKISIKEITRDDDESSSDEEDEGTMVLLDECDQSLMEPNFEYDEIDDSLLPFQFKSFSLFNLDEYDESLGRDIVPSILELQEFHQEHQLQISNNTLPFLSLECGMDLNKKGDDLEHHLTSKSSLSTMIGAVDLLQSSSISLEHGNGASSFDWSAHGNERNSIMKAITYVLAEKSISNLLPIEYPFSSYEHIVSGSNIVLRENEPSSIISYMLASQFYNEKLERKQQVRMSKAATAADIFNEEIKEKSSIEMAEGKSFFSEMFPETDEREKPWKFVFQHEATNFSCKIYFAEQFDMLRKSCGCDEIFISSLARCSQYDPAGGKSGSIFLKTQDERFLIKQISKYEMDAFLGSANKYFYYMFNEVFDKGIPTVLSKIFGLYRIGFYNNVTGKSMKMDILVMENLFYDTSVKKVFDLKGSMRNRYAEKTGRDVEVFLDENLVEIISKTPLYMKVDTKCNLSDSLYNDTQFLLSIDVMDYSLLVGFNEDTNEIYVGIVDFIRTFTWDKKLESWVKESGMLGGGRKDPTIVSPKMYRRRFRSAIDLYFGMIPDFWTLILD